MGFLDSFRVTARFRLEEARRDGLRHGWLEGHKKGLEDGRRQGLKEGFKQGYEKGKNEGRRNGRLEGMRNGLTHGHQDGKQDGLNEGRRAGYTSGFQAGLERGLKKGRAEGHDAACRALREAILATCRRRLDGLLPRTLFERLARIVELDRLQAVLIAADQVKRHEDIATMLAARPDPGAGGPAWP